MASKSQQPILSLAGDVTPLLRALGIVAKELDELQRRMNKGFKQGTAQQKKGVKQTISWYKRLGATVKAVAGRMAKLGIGILAAVVAVRLMTRMFRFLLRQMVSFVTEGFKMNRLFELMRIGVAATLAQNALILDSQGKQIKGLDAIVALQGKSEKLQKKIVAAAFEAGSSLDNFLDAFRIALPLALQMGNTVEDTVDVTKRLVLAATAIGVPFDLVRLQIDDIMRGLITTRTTLARVLGINQTQLRIAKERGKIIELIREKTQSFFLAQEKITGTMAIQIQRARLLGQVIARDITEKAFGRLRDVLKSIIDRVAKINKITGELEISPEFKQSIEDASDAFDGFVDGVMFAVPAIIKLLGGLVTVVKAVSVPFLSLAAAYQGIKGNVLFEGIGIQEETLARNKKEIKDILSLIERSKVDPSEAFIDVARKRPEGFRTSTSQVPKGQTVRGRLAVLESVNQELERMIPLNRLAAASTLKLAEEFKVLSDAAAVPSGNEALESLIRTFRLSRSINKEAELRDFSVSEFQGIAKAQDEIRRRTREFGKQAPGASLALQAANRKEIIKNVLANLLSGVFGTDDPGELVALFSSGSKKLLTKAAEVQDEFARLTLFQKDLKVVRAVKLDPGRFQKEFAHIFRLLGLPSDAEMKVVASAAKSRKRELLAISKRIGITVVPQKAELTATEKISKIRRIGAEKLKPIQEDLARLNREAIELEADSAVLGERKLSVKKAELSLRRAALLLLIRESEIETQTKAVGAAGKGSSIEAREIVRLADANMRRISQENAVIRETIKLRKAEKKEVRGLSEQLIKNEEVLSRLARDKSVLQARAEILKAEEDLTFALRDSNRFDRVKVALANELLVAAQNRLNIATAQAEIDEADQALVSARAKEKIAIDNNADDVQDAQNEVLKAEGKLVEELLDFDLARAAAARKTFEAQQDVLSSMREQAELGGSLREVFSIFTDVISSFGIGLPKSLSRVASVFDLTRKFAAKLQSDIQGMFTAQFKGVDGGIPKGITEGLGSAADALVKAFTKGEGFVKSFTAALPSMVGIVSTIGAAFSQGAGAGVGASFSAAGSLFSGSKNKALAGAAPFLAAAGIGVSLVAGLQRKKTEKIIKKITKAINSNLNAFNAGEKTLRATMQELEEERKESIRLLGRRKGASGDLDKILEDIDKTMASLKRKRKEIFDAFDRDLRNIRLHDALRDVGNEIESLNKQIKDFLEAGGDALKAQEFLALSLQDIYRNINRDLRSDELEVIDLLEREIDLQKQRADVIERAAEQERVVRARLGISRMLTPSQQAALEIREIRKKKAEDLERIDREMQLLQAQLEGKAELFDIEVSATALLERRLELTRLETAEWIARIKAIKDFLAANADAFYNAFANFAAAGGIASLPGFNGTNFLPGGGGNIIIGTVIVQGGSSTPQQAWESFQDGLKYGASQGVNVDLG